MPPAWTSHTRTTIDGLCNVYLSLLMQEHWHSLARRATRSEGCSDLCASDLIDRQTRIVCIGYRSNARLAELTISSTWADIALGMPTPPQVGSPQTLIRPPSA